MFVYFINIRTLTGDYCLKRAFLLTLLVSILMLIISANASLDYQIKSCMDR